MSAANASSLRCHTLVGKANVQAVQRRAERRWHLQESGLPGGGWEIGGCLASGPARSLAFPDPTPPNIRHITRKHPLGREKFSASASQATWVPDRSSQTSGPSVSFDLLDPAAATPVSEVNSQTVSGWHSDRAEPALESLVDTHLKLHGPLFEHANAGSWQSV